MDALEVCAQGGVRSLTLLFECKCSAHLQYALDTHFLGQSIADFNLLLRFEVDLLCLFDSESRDYLLELRQRSLTFCPNTIHTVDAFHHSYLNIHDRLFPSPTNPFLRVLQFLSGLKNIDPLFSTEISLLKIGY